MSAQDQAPAQSPASEQGAAWVYPVVILTVIYVLNFVDRQIVNILAEPIKEDLGLHDWQLGVLTGLAFAICYGLVAVPLARVAERVHRPRLIAGALTLWSAATIACRFVSGFGQLAAARVVVGLGEAGYAPAAHSLITDTVPKRRRTLAFGIFNTALPLGGMIALAIGGLIADRWGWRAAFLVAGVSGLPMALLVVATMKEPRMAERAARRADRKGFLEDAALLVKKPAFRYFWLAGGLMAMTTFGVQAFAASFLFRNHATEVAGVAQAINAALGTSVGGTAVVGPALGVILGVMGISSALISGYVTDRLVVKSPRFYGFCASAPLFVAAPLLVSSLFAPTLPMALGLLALFFFFNGMPGPAWVAGIQGLAGVNNRATASAISLLATVLLGTGLGPFLIGVMSDVFASGGLESGPALRLAIAAGVTPSVIAAVLYLIGQRHLARDLES